MTKRKDEQTRIPTDAPAALSHSPFAALAGKRDELPAAPAAAPGAAKLGADSAAVGAAGAAAKPLPSGPARAVVRMERKGRGGKEVTVVEQLGLRERELAEWLKALKGALGCGGAVEGATLVLQGDHRPRVKALLEERGVRRVTLG